MVAAWQYLQYPEAIASELKRIIRTYEFETGNRIPLQNGAIVLDLKNQFNQPRQYQQRNDLDYFK